MKARLATAGGLGGILAAAAAAGVPVFALLVIVLLVLAAVGCWVIANRDRTENTVALITAARIRPDVSVRAPRPRRARQRRTAGSERPRAVLSRQQAADPQLEQTDG